MAKKETVKTETKGKHGAEYEGKPINQHKALAMGKKVKVAKDEKGKK